MRVACLAFHEDLDFESIAEGLLYWSPQISISRSRAVFVEIGKCRKILTESEFLSQVQAFLEEFNLQAQIAIGNDVAQALALARYGSGLPLTQRVDNLPLESLTELSFPYGPSEENQRGLERMLHALKLVGLRTVGEFCRLPTSEFSSRFGKLGLFCRLCVEEGCPELWQNWKPREIISESLPLDYDQACPALEPLIFLSKQLLDRMFLRLRGLNLSLSTLSLELKFENLSTVRHKSRLWKMTFMLPQTAAKSVLTILRERLDRELAHTPLEADITFIGLTATETVQSYDGQKNFFNQHNEDQERLAAVLGHLAECVGKEKVFQALLSEDRFPEKSWRKFNQWLASDVDVKNAYPERPLRLLAPPLKLEVTANMIFLNRRGFKVSAWSDIERLSGHWLDGLEIRNYYKVQIESGPPLWVFQNPEQVFYLHGYYE